LKRVKETDTAISGINVIPIIDVCLVLLVVLFVISPVISVEILTVNLPEAITKETRDQNITVSLSADGRISIDSIIVTYNELPAYLRRMLKDRQDSVVIVRADKDLPYSAVEQLIKTVNRHAGNNAVAIATRQRSTPLEVTQQ
jgi:biopolymer transport protein TolR